MDTGTIGLIGSLAKLSNRSLKVLSRYFVTRDELIPGLNATEGAINTVITQQLADGGTIDSAIQSSGGGSNALFSGLDTTDYVQTAQGNVSEFKTVQQLRDTYTDLDSVVAAMLSIGPTPAYSLSAGMPGVAFTISPSEGIQMGSNRTVSYTVNVSLGSWSGGTAYSSAEKTGTITEAYNSVTLPQLYVSATSGAVAFASNQQATLTSFALESIPLQISDVSFTGRTAYNNYGSAHVALDKTISPTFNPSTIRTYGIVTHTYPGGLTDDTGRQTETGHGEAETQRVYADTPYIIVFGHNHDGSPNESNRSVVRSPRPASSITVWDSLLTNAWITPSTDVQNTAVTDEFGVQYYEIGYTAANGRDPTDVKIVLQQYQDPSV